MTLLPSTISDDAFVQDMTAARSILPIAEALAIDCFKDVRNRQVVSESDPETSERWIELRLTVAGTPEEVANAYDRYVAKWVEAIPWPKHNWVRLSYIIA